MATQLEAGAIDVARLPHLVDFNRLKTDSKYQPLLNPLTGAHYEARFNLTMPPFDNKKLRQALSYAVDKKRFVDTILGGVGAPESLPWLPSSAAYEQSKQDFYAFDLNNSAFKSEKYVQLITGGATETDPARLKDAYSQLNDLVLDESFVFLITISPPTMLAKANVQGIAWTAHESPWYVNTWLA